MTRRCLCLLWSISALALLATSARADDRRLGGGTRWYGGREVVRPVTMPEGVELPEDATEILR